MKLRDLSLQGRLRPWWGAALFFLFFLAAVSPAASQELTGKVLDDGTGQPVSGVLLELIGRDGEVAHSRTTGEDGGFRFLGLPPGHYRLRGERLGYQETVSGFLALEPEDEVELEFRMAMEAIVLEPLTVTASPRPWYEHLKAPALWEYYERSEYLKRIGRGRFLGPDDLKNLAGMPVSFAISTVPGMQAVQSDVSPSRFHVLGRRGCDALFFLNGMHVRLRAPINRADTNDVDFAPGPEPLDWFIDDFVSLHEVEAIEVYRGPSELPGEFHGVWGGANCGAVVVWTKRDVEAVTGGGSLPPQP